MPYVPRKVLAYTSSWYPTSSVLPTRMVGDRKLPVGPNMALTQSPRMRPLIANSVIFFPLITINLAAAARSVFASSTCSFRLAGATSSTSMLFASKNLDALAQVVQPLR